MNWKNTWILVGLAASLLAFILLFERRLKPSGYVEAPTPLLKDFIPTTATNVTVRRGMEFNLALQRSNDAWRFVRPFTYPAATAAVQQFLEALERAVPTTRISPREILARKQTSADFGFDPAPVAIVLEGAGNRVDVKFGARTPSGEQVYVQVGTDPSVFLVSVDLLERMPRTANDWRNAALFDLGGEAPDRLEIAHNGSGYALQLDSGSKLWRLVRPMHRADQSQVHELVRRILQGRIVEFVSDDVRVDGDGYGLLAPEYEVSIGAGSVVRRVQIGRSPTNNPGLVYARLLTHSNVVLIAKSAVEPLAVPYSELRERQVVGLNPELVDIVEVRGEESFAVRRDATGAWKAGDTIADPAFVAEWLRDIARMEAIEFVRDVVTDYRPYGLAPGQRQYTLRTTVTNSAGVTNVEIATIAFGTNGTPTGFFVRRFDEESVYRIRATDYTRMPGAAWQFRDHRVWSFTTNQVVKISVQQGEGSREVVRQPTGEWIPVRAWAGDINQFAMEEITRSLGDLTARMWLARGPSVRERFGFGTESTRFSVELRGEQPRTLTIEFGGRSPLQLPYALTEIDGQPTIFEFPWVLYADMQRYFQLSTPTPRQP